MNEPEFYTEPMGAPERPRDIIVADDDDLVRAVLRMALQGSGTAVRDAPDSRTLTTELSTAPADLVILDISIPGPGLTDNIATIRHLAPTARILVLSGDMSVPNDAADLVDDFARKPIELDDLRRRVNDLLSAPAHPDFP